MPFLNGKYRVSLKREYMITTTKIASYPKDSEQAKEIFELFFRRFTLLHKPIFSRKILLKDKDKWFITDKDFKELIEIAEKKYNVNFNKDYFDNLGFSKN